MNFTTTSLPALLTYSGQDIREENEMSFATKLDWGKIPRFLSGDWPQPYPKAHLFGENWVADRRWLQKAAKAAYVVFDVETVQIGKKEWSGDIFQVGLYAKGVGPAIWDRALYAGFEEKFVTFFRNAAKMQCTVAHNAAFDVARIKENFGIDAHEYTDLNDTILMHHLQWAEFPHRLEFIASLCSPHPKAKHLGVGNYDYLVGDVVDTALYYEQALKDFEKDHASAKLYHEELKPLLPIIVEWQERGVPVNQDFVEECLEWIPQQVEYAKDIANAYAGFDVSLSSGPQLRLLLDGVEDIFETVKKLGMPVKKELTEKGELSLGRETVTGLRSAFIPVDAKESITPELVDQRIAHGAHPLLEAKSLYEGARILMSNYIKPLLIELDEEDCYAGSLHVGDGAPKPIGFLEAFREESDTKG